MKTAISLPDSMFEAANRMAKRLGISRSQLFQRAVQQYLGEQRQAGLTETLNEVYGAESSAGKLSPLLQELQTASLPREDW
jgi:metal-responsive CopG/Arc/MetJ family transcriptional regulator